MKMTQSHQRSDIWERRTRWRNGFTKTHSFQEYLYKLEMSNTSSRSVPVCLELIGMKGSYHLSPARKLDGNANDQTSKSRGILMPKENNGRSLEKSNSLPPIYTSRISTISMSSANICVSSWGVGCQEKKANIFTSIKTHKALFSRQKQRCQLTAATQLICNGLAVFNENLQVQTQDLRQDEVKSSDPAVLGAEPSDVSANDGERMTERMMDSASVSKGRPAQTLSDSDIEMENEKDMVEMIDDQEDEYYTNQRITAWVVKVNTCLFSPSKDEIIDQTLEEQDVDTIKIIYD